MFYKSPRTIFELNVVRLMMFLFIRGINILYLVEIRHCATSHTAYFLVNESRLLILKNTYIIFHHF